MKIERIFIRNFRPIGENGLELIFATSCTSFVGENNVGKSSIFEALKKILEPQTTWDKEDWHAGDQSKSIEIRLDCILDDDQIREIIEILEVPLTVTSFRENFTGKLIYHYEYETRKTLSQLSLLFKLGELTIEKKFGATTGWIGEIDRNAGFTGDNWPNIVSKIKSQKSENLMLIIKESLEEIQSKQSGSARIYFAPDFADNLLRLLKQSIIVIEEFREKPQKTLVEFQASPTGRELASVLFKLKNGRFEKKEKFEQIRQKFHKLFPILELDILREENNEIKILIQKAGIESTTFYLGAGILETLLLLTHLIAHYDKVLCIDHPELHLHPHAQRGLASVIEESKDSRILIITHSPYFVNLNKNSSIIRFIQKGAQTEIIELPQDYFTDDDFFKLEQFLDIDTKELFFARKVVLVEGPTELGALPIFASLMGYNFDEDGASLISVSGIGNFEIFVKLCEGFKIPYFIIADKDASAILTKIKSRYFNCQSQILPDKFDDLLPIEYRKEAEKVVGNSKSRIGRYVARMMLEKGSEVPEEIKQIIEQVKNL